MKAYVLQVLITLVLGLLVQACTNEQGSQADERTQEQFAKIRVHPDNQHLLLTYLQADGSFASVQSIDEVPEKAREQVIVVDTSLSPEQRKSGQILYVADLTQAKDDGTYPYSLVSRFKFERDLMRDPAASSGVLPPECKGLTESAPDKVLLYKTDWCGVCKAAESYLAEQKIPFQAKDVEKDPLAQKELWCKSLKAGKRLGGVPVLDVGGELMLGFDANRLQALIRNLKRSESAPSTGSAPRPTTPPSP